MRPFFLCVCGLVLCFCADFPASAEQIEHPGEIVIDHITRPGRGDLAVVFPHRAHEAFACADCHHMDADDPAPCVECHTETGMRGLDAHASFFRVTHIASKTASACRACHKEMFGDRQYAGCSGSVCHPGGL